MDGVLLASEALKAEAHSATMREFGATVPPLFYAQVMGRSQQEVQRAFMGQAGVRIPDPEYLDRFRARYAALLEMVRLTDGVPELLSRLRAREFRLGLVTSSLRWMVDHVLERFGLAAAFDAVICAEDISREKPDPQPYVLALTRLRLAPSSTVVIEDSEAGVQSGLAAGCRVIALRHFFNESHDFSRALRVIDSLREVDNVVRMIEGSLIPGEETWPPRR